MPRITAANGNEERPTQNRNQSKRKARGGVDYPFPERLFDLLEEVDTRKPFLSSIISWQPNGKSFTVHDRDAFEKVIQSTYFNQTKFASFRRQLNLWGYERVYIDHDADNTGGGSFFHPLFQRHNKRLCCTMKRTKVTTHTGVVPRLHGGLEEQQGGNYQKVYPFSASENMIEERSTDTFAATGLSLDSSGSTNTTTLTNLCLPKVSTNPRPISDDGSSLPSQEYIQLEHKQDETKQEYDFDPTKNHEMKEFKDLIEFLSANDDNIVEFLLGGDTTEEEEEEEWSKTG